MKKKISILLMILIILMLQLTTITRAIEWLENDLDSNEYLVTDNYVSRIMPKTEVNDFKNKLSTQNVQTFKDEAMSQEITSGYVGTNMYIKTPEKVRQISVISDINGDGLANQVDLTKLIRHVKNVNKITDEEEKASADVTGDLITDATDITPVVRYIVFEELESSPYPNPRISNIETDSTTKRIKINVTASNMDGGVYQYLYKAEGETNFTEAEKTKENSCIITGVKKNTKYIVQVKAISKYGSSTKAQVETITEVPSAKKEGALEYTIRWENGKAIVDFTTNTDYDVEWQKGGTSGAWTTSNQARDLEHGDYIYARLTDGEVSGESERIDIRDTKNPTIREVSSSTTKDSITLTVTATDNESGMPNPVNYVFYIKKSGELDSGYRKIQEGANATLTEDGLSANTKYTIKVEARDKAGNIGTLIKELITKSSSSGDGPGGGPGDDSGNGEDDLIGIIEQDGPTIWVDGKAIVKLKTNTNYDIQWQVNTKEGEWTTGKIITDLKHGDTIYARLWDGTKAGAYTSISVQDNISPIIEEESSSRTGTEASITVRGIDNESGLPEPPTYVFYIKKTAEEDTAYVEVQRGPETTMTKDGLEPGISYTIKVEVTDVAGNVGTLIKETTEEGYMRIHLYYPEDSVDRQWRIGRPGETRTDGDLVWQYYTGEPILVKIDDIKNIWIRYNLEGVEVVKAPEGRVAVDIRATPKTKNVEKVTVSVYFDSACTNKKVKIGTSGWVTYKGPFEVTENCTIQAMGEKQIDVTDNDGNFLGTTTVKGKDSLRITNIGEPEKDDTLEAPTIVEIVAQGTEVARVRIDYPTDKGDIRKVYKINSGPEQEYIGEIPIEEWGTEVMAYYYKENKQSKKDKKKFEDPTKLDVDIFVQPNPALDSTVKSTTVEIEYSEESEEMLYKIDSGREQKYVGPFTVTQNCMVTAYARKTGVDEAKESESIKFKEEDKSLKAPTFSKEDALDYKSAMITIKYDAKAETKQYRINGGELQEYNGPFEVANGDFIYATSADSEGNFKDATYTVEIKIPKIDKPTFNQTNSEDKTKATLVIKFDDERAVIKQYSINGGTLQDYTGPFEVVHGDVIYAKNTDEFGQTAEATHTVKIRKEEIKAPTFSKVDSSDKTKTTITIKYDEDLAVSKQYRINAGLLIDYTGPFEAVDGDIIYAINTDEDGNSKYATYIVKINKIDANIKAPKFSGENNSDNTKVIITIDYDENAVIKQYSINAGTLMDYNGPFEASHGDVIYAVNSNSEGTSKDATYKVDIEDIDAPKITAENNSDNTKIIVTIKYDDEKAVSKQYRINGGELKDYEGPFEALDGDEIYAINTDSIGRSKYTTYTVNAKQLTPPVINVNYSSDKQKATVSIKYDSEATTKKYSINGGELKDYTSSFEITENGTVIYAVSTDVQGNKQEDTYTIDKIVKKLEVEITIDPITTEKVDSVTVTITYDENATEKTYSINGATSKEYTGPFEVTENCTIIAEAKATGAYGEDKKQIKNLRDGVAAPIIKVTKTKEEGGEVANITIEYDENSISNTYAINNEQAQKYTSGFQIRENGTIITAHSIDKKGNTSTSQYVIRNLVRYLLIDKGKYYLITLPYPEESTNREYKYKSDGVWKDYKEDGFILVKPEYEDELIQGGKPIKIEVEAGRYVDFDGHWYILAGDPSSLQEDIYMRWDDPNNSSTPRVSLQILALPQSPEMTDAVDVFIIYPSTAVAKQYKINDGEWQDYTKQLYITENNTTITARAQYADGSWTEEIRYTITNIDGSMELEGAIDINANPTEITSENVTVTINYNPIRTSLLKKYKVGNGKWEYTEENSIKLTIEENTKIYAAFENLQGQSSDAVVYNVNNIDKDAPEIKEILITDASDTNIAVETVAKDDTGIVKYEYMIDTASYVEDSDTHNFTGLSKGNNYTITVRVTDMAGRTAEKSVVAATGVVIIRNATDLANVTENLEADYLIVNDITMPSTWTPIIGFEGSLNGGGHTIKNLKLTEANEGNVGIFGTTVSGAAISNLNLEDITINATGQYIGGLVGKSATTTYDNITVTGTINVDDTAETVPYVGSLIGYSTSQTLSNIDVDTIIKASIIQKNISVGGITGYASSSKGETNCSSKGSIEIGSAYESANIYAGGFTGDSANATNCNSSTKIDIMGIYSKAYVGGFAASSGGSSNNCYYSGEINVSGSYSSANVAGFSTTIGTNSKLLNCYSTANITVTNESDSNSSVVGGLLCYTKGYLTSSQKNGTWILTKYSPTVTNCYNTGNIKANAEDIGGLIANATATTVSKCYSTGNIEGTGTGTSEIGGLLATTSSMFTHFAHNGPQKIQTYVSSSYSTGNISVSAPNVYAGGLVGSAVNGGISNCFATGDVEITYTDSKGYVGGLVGYQTGGRNSTTGTLFQAYSNYCYASGRVTGGNYQGGLIGAINREQYCVPGINSSYYIAEGTGTVSNEVGTEISTFVLGRQAQSYTGFDFSDVWTIKEGITTPYLIALPMPDSVN